MDLPCKHLAYRCALIVGGSWEHTELCNLKTTYPDKCSIRDKQYHCCKSYEPVDMKDLLIGLTLKVDRLEREIDSLRSKHEKHQHDYYKGIFYGFQKTR